MRKGDTVAIMLGNRWEFIPTDLAAVSLGAIPFSVYQTYAPEQIQYLLSDAESKLVITEQAYLDNVNEARKGLPSSNAWSSSTARAAISLSTSSWRWTRSSTPPSPSSRSARTTS